MIETEPVSETPRKELEEFSYEACGGWLVACGLGLLCIMWLWKLFKDHMENWE